MRCAKTRTCQKATPTPNRNSAGKVRLYLSVGRKPLIGIKLSPTPQGRDGPFLRFSSKDHRPKKLRGKADCSIKKSASLNHQQVFELSAYGNVPGSFQGMLNKAPGARALKPHGPTYQRALRCATGVRPRSDRHSRVERKARLEARRTFLF